MFKVGDKVRCIDPGPKHYLTEMKVYTVTSVPEYNWVEIVADDGIKRGYFATRFELVTEEKPKQYVVLYGDGSFTLVDNLVGLMVGSATRVFELGDELVEKVTWEKKDA